jgi:hypothetical protein
MQLDMHQSHFWRGFTTIFCLVSDCGIDKQIMPLYSFSHDVRAVERALDIPVH